MSHTTLYFNTLKNPKGYDGVNHDSCWGQNRHKDLIRVTHIGMYREGILNKSNLGK